VVIWFRTSESGYKVSKSQYGLYTVRFYVTIMADLALFSMFSQTEAHTGRRMSVSSAKFAIQHFLSRGAHLWRMLRHLKV